MPVALLKDLSEAVPSLPASATGAVTAITSEPWTRIFDMARPPSSAFQAFLPETVSTAEMRPPAAAKNTAVMSLAKPDSGAASVGKFQHLLDTATSSVTFWARISDGEIQAQSKERAAMKNLTARSIRILLLIKPLNKITLDH